MTNAANGQPKAHIDVIARLIDQGEFSMTQKLVVAICFILNVLDGFDVVAISYAAPAISEAWTIAPATLGLVFSAGLAGMTIGAIFIAPYTDLIGRRRMILGALVVITVSMWATGYAQTPLHLIIARIATGLGIGAMLASLTSMVAEYAPERRRNFAIGFLQAGYPVGATGGGLLAAAILSEFGWQSLFFAGAFLSALMIPVVIIWLPESIAFLAARQPAGALQRINRTLQRMGRTAIDALPEISAKKGAASVRALFARGHAESTLKLWLAFFMCFFTLYFLLSWIPKIVVDAGFAQQEGIWAGVSFNLGAIIGVVGLGYLADRAGLRRLITLFLLLGGGTMVAFGFAPAGIAVLYALAFLIGAFVDGGFAGLYSVAARIYPTQIRTTGVGWAIGAGRLGAVAGPYVGGLLLAWQWPMEGAFALFAAPMVIAAAAIWVLRRPEVEAPRS